MSDCLEWPDFHFYVESTEYKALVSVFVQTNDSDVSDTSNSLFMKLMFSMKIGKQIHVKRSQSILNKMS